jgi:hypothetical protein
MGSDQPVQQKLEHAKLALRTNAEQIDFLKPVKDNPITSMSIAFLLGASSADSKSTKIPSQLLSMLIKLSAI